MPIVSSLFGRFSETNAADQDEGDEQEGGGRSSRERSGQTRARNQQRRLRIARNRKSFTFMGALKELGGGVLGIIFPARKNKVNDAVTSMMRQSRLARQQRAHRSQRTTRRNSIVGRNALRQTVEAASSKEALSSPPETPASPGTPKTPEMQPPEKKNMLFRLWCTLFFALENDVIKEARRVVCLESIYKSHRSKDEAALLEIARSPDTTAMALDPSRKGTVGRGLREDTYIEGGDPPWQEGRRASREGEGLRSRSDEGDEGARPSRRSNSAGALGAEGAGGERTARGSAAGEENASEMTSRPMAFGSFNAETRPRSAGGGGGGASASDGSRAHELAPGVGGGARGGSPGGGDDSSSSRKEEQKGRPPPIDVMPSVPPGSGNHPVETRTSPEGRRPSVSGGGPASSRSSEVQRPGMSRTLSTDATVDAAIAINADSRELEVARGGATSAAGQEVINQPTPERLRKCSTTAASTPDNSGPSLEADRTAPAARNLSSVLGGGGAGTASSKPRLHNLAAKLKGAAQQERKEMEACTVSEQTLGYLDSLSSHKGLGLEGDGATLDEKAMRRAVFVLMRRRLWITMTDPESSPLAYIISFMALFLIMVSSITFCMETLEQFDNPSDASTFRMVETVCIIAFTMEYSIKFLTAEQRLEFVKAPLNLVDLVSILPYYLEEVATSLDVKGTRILRVVRLVRVFRILKLGGRFGKIQVVWKAMTDSMDMLGMMLFLVVLSIVVFSTLIYFAERGYYDEELGYHTRRERPEIENPFRSIPESFWWTMVTLMTVGYGDQYPVTIWGKLVASMAMIVSVLILALPISVIGTNFTQQWMNYKEAGRDRSSAHRMTPEFVQLHEWLQEHNATLADLYQKIRDVEHEMDDLMFAIKDKIRLKRRQISEEKKYNARKVMIMRKVQSMKRRSDAPTGSGGTFDAAGPRSALLRHTTSSASSVAAHWIVKRRRKSAEDKAAEERRKQEEAIERGAREMSDIDALNRKLSLQKERLQEMLIVAEIMSGNNFPRAGQNFSRMLDDCRARYKEMDLVADESVALCMEAEGLQERVQQQEDELLFKQAGGGGHDEPSSLLERIRASATDDNLLDD